MEDVFRFKRFEVHHSQSAMKIGVDAVLLGAWAARNSIFSIKGSSDRLLIPGKNLKVEKILDVGTGCGVIALILAQRFQDAMILGIDIDLPSIEEAKKNFINSGWSQRLNIENLNFPKELNLITDKYDLIVSNPPFFDSGLAQPQSRREKARHTGDLSIFSLIDNSAKLLNDNGRITMIFPTEFLEKALQRGDAGGLVLKRICFVKNNAGRPEKRVMTELFRQGNILEKEGEIEETHLTLFEKGEPTPEYRALCKDLYLKF